MGGRDLENGTIEIARRDTLTKETISLDGIAEKIQKLLEEIQANLLQKALDFRIANTREVNSYDQPSVAFLWQTCRGIRTNRVPVWSPESPPQDVSSLPSIINWHNICQ